jgi:hypothetical protein
MNDDRPKRFRNAGANYLGDIAPIGEGRHAGAAKLENDPVLAIRQHGRRKRHMIFSIPRTVTRTPEVFRSAIRQRAPTEG